MNYDHAARNAQDGRDGGGPQNDARRATTSDGSHASSNRLTPAAVRWRDRLLDGSRTWGSVEAGPDRRGFRRYRLVLFPPGITGRERRLLRFWRALPTGGAALWLMSVIVLTQMYPPSGALGLATAAYLGVVLMTSVRLGAVRTQVRTLTAVLISGYPDSGAAATYAELKQLAAVLCAADTLLAEGRLSPTEHESVWWQVYERVEARSKLVDLETD